MIAVVDDDESMRDAIKGLLRALGFAVEAFSSAGDFLKSAHLSRTACLVADVSMPGMSGPDLYSHLKATGRGIPTILVTAYSDEGLRESALAAGVISFLSKPFAKDDLLASIHSALDRKGEGKRES